MPVRGYGQCRRDIKPGDHRKKRVSEKRWEKRRNSTVPRHSWLGSSWSLFLRSGGGGKPVGIFFKYLSLPTTRKTVSPMKVSNFKTSKLTSHRVYKKLVLTIFTEPIMHPVYSQKFCITIVFSFPWDDCNTQGKLETMVMKNLGG